MNQDRTTVGHVLHSLDRAGAEVLAADLARKLSDRYRFVFLCLDGVGPLGVQLASEGFDVVDLTRRPGIDWSLGKRIRAEVKRHRIGLLHAHQYTPFFYAALSRGLGSSPPILFTEHGRHYPDQRKLKRVLANRWLLKPGDRVTAVGRFVADALTANEGIPGERVRVVYNGIDPDAFPLADTESRAAARKLMGGPGEPGDGPVVLQVARFHPVKDHDTAVRGFAHALKRVPNARLVLVGDGPERAATEALTAELDIHERVEFMGIRSDVAALLPGADAFMLSSVSEGVSVTLLEAMSTGLAIVATDVGGNGEVVEHGETGLLSPRGDDRGLGENLADALTDADRRRTMGAAGRAKLLEQFTQERMHRAYAEVYGQTI